MFEAVGVPGIIDDVLLRARPGTRLVVAGVCMQPDTMHPFFAIAKEINVQFVLAYTPEEFAESLRALAEGEIDVDPADHRRGRPRRGRRRPSTTWPTPSGTARFSSRPDRPGILVPLHSAKFFPKCYAVSHIIRYRPPRDATEANQREALVIRQ